MTRSTFLTHYLIKSYWTLFMTFQLQPENKSPSVGAPSYPCIRHRLQGVPPWWLSHISLPFKLLSVFSNARNPSHRGRHLFPFAKPVFKGYRRGGHRNIPLFSFLVSFFLSLSAPPLVASRGIFTSSLPDRSLRVSSSSSHRISLSQGSSNCERAPLSLPAISVASSRQPARQP